MLVKFKRDFPHICPRGVETTYRSGSAFDLDKAVAGVATATGAADEVDPVKAEDDKGAAGAGK